MAPADAGATVDAYIYLRFSTPRQERGSSRERQLQDCRAFVERMGWREVDVIADLGRSAWKGDHLKSGNLGKFAKRILDGDIPAGSVIVVENLDRLSRQKPRVTQRWMEDVCDRGLRIATVKGGKVFDAQSLEENILDILDVLYQGKAANDYVETLSHRVKTSYEKRLEKARIDNTAVSTLGPAWLAPLPGPPWWRPIPERAALIREIFDMAAAGMAPWTIAKEFNDRPVKSFTGKAWERTAIVKIIRNRAVEGDYVVGEGKSQKPTGEVLLGYYGEPIVPLDVIAAARTALDRRRQLRPGRGRNSGAVRNIFGQKLRCGTCGGRMAQFGYQARYLVCYEASRNNGCTQKTSFHYRPFERAALDSILHLALDETFFRQAAKSNDLTREIAEVEKTIRDKTAEAGRLVDILSRIASPTTEAKVAEIEAEIVALKGRLLQVQSKLAVAQGGANAKAHAERVHGVREALYHCDDAVRLPARLRVSEALQSVVHYVMCEIVEGERRFELALMGGAYAVRFDGNGGKIAEVGGDLETIHREWGVQAEPMLRRLRA